MVLHPCNCERNESGDATVGDGEAKLIKQRRAEAPANSLVGMRVR